MTTITNEQNFVSQFRDPWTQVSRDDKFKLKFFKFRIRKCLFEIRIGILTYHISGINPSFWSIVRVWLLCMVHPQNNDNCDKPRYIFRYELEHSVHPSRLAGANRSIGATQLLVHEQRAILISNERGGGVTRRHTAHSAPVCIVPWNELNRPVQLRIVPGGGGGFTVKAGETNPPCYPRATLALTHPARAPG